ncbi:hypothetical protein SAMN05444000_1259 [Shimia gijangensis]|uniref:Uncharacterized protein n=1 Tax=Shimia gijangensis TaxID=1470563 RepID=A0A1M6RDW7_9RHOB|nr:DUF2092 domain-containing protein [Shimia gijangensis]SHK30664.1 hypothetical protein SAMN05444000_1259 [Shimia gijangensis]
MKTFRLALMGLTLPLTLAFSSVAEANDTDDPPAKDPQAIEILGNASEFLSSQQNISVSWFVSYDDVVDGREKITHTRSGHTLLAREGGLYSYSENGLKTREFFFDGTSFSMNDPDQNVYAEILFSGGFEALIVRIKEEYGLDLPIWSVLSTQQKEIRAESATTMAYLGLTRVGGEMAHHVAVASYDEDWQIWVADDPENPRLLMIVGTDPYIQGWPQYRAYFTNWDFAPEISEGAFVFTPNEDSERMSWPKVPSQ